MYIQNGNGLLQQAANAQTNTVTKKGNTEMNISTVAQAVEFNNMNGNTAKAAATPEIIEKTYLLLKAAGIQPKPWIERFYSKRVDIAIKPSDRVARVAIKLGQEEANYLWSMDRHGGFSTTQDTKRPSAEELVSIIQKVAVLPAVELPAQLRNNQFHLAEFLDQVQRDPSRHSISADGRPYTVGVQTAASNKLARTISQLTKVAYVAEGLDPEFFNALRKMTSVLVGVRQRIDKRPLAIAEFQIIENERGFGHESNEVNAENLEEAIVALHEMGAIPRRIMDIIKRCDTEENLMKDDQFVDWYQDALERLGENREANIEAAANAVTYRKPTDLMGHDPRDVRTIAESVHHFSDFQTIRANYKLKDMAYMKSAVSTAVNYALGRNLGIWQDIAAHFEERMGSGVMYARTDRETKTRRAWKMRGTKFYAKHRKLALEQKNQYMRARRQMLNYVRFIKSVQGLGVTEPRRRNTVMQHGLNKFGRRIFRDLFMAKKELSRLHDWMDNIHEVRDYVLNGAPLPGGMDTDEYERFMARVNSIGRTAISAVTMNGYDDEPLAVKAFGFVITSIDVPENECDIVADGQIRILTDIANKLELLIAEVEGLHKHVRKMESVLEEAGFWDDRPGSLFPCGGRAPLYWDMRGAYFTEVDAVRALSDDVAIVDEDVIDVMEFEGENWV